LEFGIFIVGGAGFEPAKSYDNRFTVCPSWPLWYPPSFFKESQWPDLNRRPAVYKTAALPLSYTGISRSKFQNCLKLENKHRAAKHPFFIHKVKNANLSQQVDVIFPQLKDLKYKNICKINQPLTEIFFS
jgi:hypothetical protein